MLFFPYIAPKPFEGIPTNGLHVDQFAFHTISERAKQQKRERRSGTKSGENDRDFEHWD